MASYPLDGRTIGILRAAPQAMQTATQVTIRGGNPLVMPVVEIVGLETPPIEQIEQFDWVVLTSTNAVDHFFRIHNRAESLFPAFAVVGHVTANRLRAHRAEPTFMPTRATGEALAEELPIQMNHRVLMPRSAIGRPELVQRLTARGAEVEEISVYTTRIRAIDPTEKREFLSEADALLITSPSIAQGLMDGLALDQIDPKIILASIGPTTTAAMVEIGIPPTLESKKSTLNDLLDQVAVQLNHTENSL